MTQTTAPTYAPTYDVTSQLGMTPFASCGTPAEALAAALQARRQGLAGRVYSHGVDVTDDRDIATPAVVRHAAQLLGWDTDGGASEMDRPVSIAAVLTSWR